MLLGMTFCGGCKTNVLCKGDRVLPLWSCLKIGVNPPGKASGLAGTAGKAGTQGAALGTEGRRGVHLV